MLMISVDEVIGILEEYAVCTPDEEKSLIQRINQASMFIDNIGTVSKWISVKDRLPQKRGWKVMNWDDFYKGLQSDNELPNGAEDEVACLVTCQEWDLFDGKWGDKEVRILSYSIKEEQWNTKSDIRVLAWMPLPQAPKENNYVDDKC